ncbi:hypothetical protein C8R47DRAFT_1064124 [Mycena vitilis]|nr:hypothetical protein C8R47DRAFT_1064124 [Mycena vitilis]
MGAKIWLKIEPQYKSESSELLRIGRWARRHKTVRNFTWYVPGWIRTTGTHGFMRYIEMEAQSLDEDCIWAVLALQSGGTRKQDIILTGSDLSTSLPQSEHFNGDPQAKKLYDFNACFRVESNHRPSRKCFGQRRIHRIDSPVPGFAFEIWKAKVWGKSVIAASCSTRRPQSVLSMWTTKASVTPSATSSPPDDFAGWNPLDTWSMKNPGDSSFSWRYSAPAACLYPRSVTHVQRRRVTFGYPESAQQECEASNAAARSTLADFLDDKLLRPSLSHADQLLAPLPRPTAAVLLSSSAQHPTGPFHPHRNREGLRLPFRPTACDAGVSIGRLQRPVASPPSCLDGSDIADDVSRAAECATPPLLGLGTAQIRRDTTRCRLLGYYSMAPWRPTTSASAPHVPAVDTCRAGEAAAARIADPSFYARAPTDAACACARGPSVSSRHPALSLPPILPRIQRPRTGPHPTPSIRWRERRPMSLALAHPRAEVAAHRRGGREGWDERERMDGSRGELAAARHARAALSCPSSTIRTPGARRYEVGSEGGAGRIESSTGDEMACDSAQSLDRRARCVCRRCGGTKWEMREGRVERSGLLQRAVLVSTQRGALDARATPTHRASSAAARSSRCMRVQRVRLRVLACSSLDLVRVHAPRSHLGMRQRTVLVLDSENADGGRKGKWTQMGGEKPRSIAQVAAYIQLHE